MPDYSIQTLAREFDVTARALRFYESKGLLSPERQGVKRVYSERDRVRLALTVRGKRLGFSLEEIREIIDLYDPEQPSDPRQLLLLLQKIHEHRSNLINKYNDLTNILKEMDEVENAAFRALQSRRGDHLDSPGTDTTN